ncbi:MAG: hypothetical protein ACUVQX_04350 [Candidatus Bathycorpusculaceae bacterium]
MKRKKKNNQYSAIVNSTEEIKAEETKCIAKGDPYCQFEVSRA